MRPRCVVGTVTEHKRDRSSRRAAAVSISANICGAAKTLHALVKLAEVGVGGRTGIQTEVASELKALERESRE